MTNEEIYKAVEEERRKKEEINQMWVDLKCPVCGGNDFRYHKSYSLLNIKELLNLSKGRGSGDADYNVIPYECQECGYVALRKGK